MDFMSVVMGGLLLLVLVALGDGLRVADLLQGVGGFLLRDVELTLKVLLDLSCPLGILNFAFLKNYLIKRIIPLLMQFTHTDQTMIQQPDKLYRLSSPRSRRVPLIPRLDGRAHLVHPS